MKVRLTIDGVPCLAPADSTLAAVMAGKPGRHSVSGQTRAALCGMGVCFECRTAVDGRPHQRACQLLVREGMEVRRED